MLSNEKPTFKQKNNHEFPPILYELHELEKFDSLIRVISLIRGQVLCLNVYCKNSRCSSPTIYYKCDPYESVKYLQRDLKFYLSRSS